MTRDWHQLNQVRVRFWQHPILWCVVVVLGLLAVMSLLLGLWSVLLIWLVMGVLALRLIYPRSPNEPTFKH